MRRCSILVIVAIAAPQVGVAGPWARGEGQVFLSSTYEALADLPALVEGASEVDQTLSLYGEIGLSPALTFGVDAAVDADFGGPGGGGVALAFLRRTLTSADATHQVAVTGGIGAGDAGAFPVIGASWGRGLMTRWGSGWTTVDVQVRSLPGQGPAAKVDGTLEIKPRDDLSLIGQVFLAGYPGSDLSVRLGTSVVTRLTDRTSVELGVVQDLTGDRRTGARLGTWLEF